MQDLKQLIQDLGETFNNPQIRESGYFNFYDENLKIYGFPEDLSPNKDGFRKFIHLLWIAFPDIRITFEDIITEQNKAACRYFLTGTHSGDFLHYKPTHRTFKVNGMTIFDFQNDLIKQRWNVLDLMDLVDQLK